MSTQQTALTKFLEVDGVKLAFRLIGTSHGSAPPLLLLNHIRSTIDLWDPAVVDPLSATRQVILYDYAGNGHSTGEVATSVAQMSKTLISFLNALFEKLSISEVDVLGFSVGGFVAQQLTLDAPHLVRKLILSGTQPSFGPDLVNPAIEFQEIALIPIPNQAILMAIFNPQTPTSQVAAGEWVGRMFQRSGNLPSGETFADFLVGEERLARLAQAYLSWSAETLPYALLPSISKEVLVTAGHSDALVPTTNSFVLSQRLQNAFFVTYPDSGHGHLFQFADLYTKQVIDFLDGKFLVGATGVGN